MESQESTGQNSPGKPFLLRPSALASPGAFGSSFPQTNKPSLLLRPSKLAAIADQIENCSTDTKKRKAEEDQNQASANEDDDEAALKKSKTEEDGDNAARHLELNEQIKEPRGIGSFGFGKEDDANNSSQSNNSKEKDKSTSSCFIFGQNINERVSGFQEITEQEKVKAEHDADGKAKLPEEEQEKNLVQNATEHMKKEESNKILLKEVEVFTGEEGERNVLQIQCKLHLFNKESTNWIEKGRGTLKLNDICQSEKHGVFQSRIVFRSLGSHLVVLNTYLWPEMCYDKASTKSLRMTAMNPETKKINVYLITAPSKDILQIHTAIDRRILALKRNKEEAGTSAQSEESCDNEVEGTENDGSHTELPDKSEETKDEDEESVAEVTNETVDSDNSNESSGIDT